MLRFVWWCREVVGGNGIHFGYIAMLKVNTVANQKWLAGRGGYTAYPSVTEPITRTDEYAAHVAPLTLATVISK
jgi:hypothetical protein